jgi:hypothetical protein
VRAFHKSLRYPYSICRCGILVTANDCYYSIIRSHRDKTTTETVVETGLTWEDADAKRDILSCAETTAHPEKSCWTRDVFVVRLEPVTP